MAKITRQLNDIEKLVQESHKTPKERLKQVNDELKYFQDMKMYGNDGELNLNLQKEKTLIEAKKILEEQIEQEEDKKELNKIKLERANTKVIKEEIQEELFNKINSYFIPKKHNKKVAYEVLCEYESIEEITDNIVKIYGEEFKDYILLIYHKTLNQVYNIYKPYIKLQEQQQKEQEQYNRDLARYRKAKKQNRNKKIIATNLAICGILRWANSKKR